MSVNDHPNRAGRDTVATPPDLADDPGIAAVVAAGVKAFEEITPEQTARLRALWAPLPGLDDNQPDG